MAETNDFRGAQQFSPHSVPIGIEALQNNSQSRGNKWLGSHTPTHPPTPSDFFTGYVDFQVGHSHSPSAQAILLFLGNFFRSTFFIVGVFEATATAVRLSNPPKSSSMGEFCISPSKGMSIVLNWTLKSSSSYANPQANFNLKCISQNPENSISYSAFLKAERLITFK